MIEGLFLNSRGVIGLPGFPASPEGLRGGLFRHSDHRQPRTNGLLSLEGFGGVQSLLQILPETCKKR